MPLVSEILAIANFSLETADIHHERKGTTPNTLQTNTKSSTDEKRRKFGIVAWACVETSAVVRARIPRFCPNL